MRILPGLLAGVLALLLAVPAGVRGGDDAKTEAEKFQGKWKPTKIEGRNPLKLDGLLVTVTGDKLTLRGATEKPLQFTLKLDPAAKPKAIDITFELGTLLGVYELDGDTLKVCYSELQESEKGKRPTELTAPADSNRYLWVLKREK
jgi:uncharacterized protein (TIGR03067 family)